MFHPVGHPMERGWVGRVDGDRVVHLAAQTLQSFFTGGGTAREHAEYPLEETVLLAPVLHPPSIRIFDDARVVRVRESRGDHRPGRGSSPGPTPSLKPSRARRRHRRGRRDRRVHGARGVASDRRRASEGSRLRARSRARRRDAEQQELRSTASTGRRPSRSRRQAPAPPGRHPGCARVRAARGRARRRGGRDRGRRDRGARAARRCVTALVVDWDGTVTEGDGLHLPSRSSATPTSTPPWRRVGTRADPAGGHRARVRDRPCAARRGRRLGARERRASRGLRRPRSAARAAGGLEWFP